MIIQYECEGVWVNVPHELTRTDDFSSASVRVYG